MLLYSNVCNDVLCSLFVRAAFVISLRIAGENTNTQQTNALFFRSTRFRILWRKSFSRPSPRCGSRSACVSSVKLHAGEEKDSEWGSAASESIPWVIHLLLRRRKMSAKKVNTLHSETDASWDVCCLPLHCLNHPNRSDPATPDTPIRGNTMK